MKIKIYCLACRPHTNWDHSIYTRECLLSGCACNAYQAGESAPQAPRAPAIAERP